VDKPLATPGLAPGDKNNFAPRFGFAWRPFGGARNSVRGSYGIFSEAANNNNELLFGSFNYPHLLAHSLTNDITRPSFVWSNLFPGEVTVGSVGFSSLDTTLPAGYLQQWSLNLQREVRKNLALEVGYMGSKGTKLDWRNNANQAVLDADPSKPTPLAARQPYPSFATGASLITRNGFSNFHGLVSRLERSFSGGLQFSVSYMFSKSIDNSSFAALRPRQAARAVRGPRRQADRRLAVERHHAIPERQPLVGGHLGRRRQRRRRLAAGEPGGRSLPRRVHARRPGAPAFRPESLRHSAARHVRQFGPQHHPRCPHRQLGPIDQQGLPHYRNGPSGVPDGGVQRPESLAVQPVRQHH
jgi:hypothetical protein